MSVCSLRSAIRSSRSAACSSACSSCPLSPPSSPPRRLRARRSGFIWQGPRSSYQECCNECANRETCRSWDWNGNICYVKDNASGRKTEKGRWSGVVAESWTKNSTYSWAGRSVPAQALTAYADASWEVVDAPHDAGRGREGHCLGGGRRRLAAAGDATANASSTDYLNNCSSWYRKHFRLPSAWKIGATWIYFEGVQHNSIIWLNGKAVSRHENGYTSFAVDVSGANFGDQENVITVFADAGPGAGYWYEGGGLTRHQYLVHTGALHMPPDST